MGEATVNSFHPFPSRIMKHTNDHQDGYDVACPYRQSGCTVFCRRKCLEAHLKECQYANKVKENEAEALRGELADTVNLEVRPPTQAFTTRWACYRAHPPTRDCAELRGCVPELQDRLHLCLPAG